MSGVDGYIKISPQDLVVLLVARLLRDIEYVDSNPTNWWFIVQDLELALTAQLVAFLSGSMQIGALTQEHQVIMSTYINDRSPTKQWPKDKRGKPIKEKLAPFHELIERATDPNRQISCIGETRLILTIAEKDDIIKIHEFRNDLAHVKPRSWHLQVNGLPRMAAACVKAIENLFSNSSQKIHLTELERTETEKRLKLLLQRLNSMQIINV
jgi:hypothetical protein